MAVAYKHSYIPASMYGNVVALLREHAATSGLHLDIGCGYGAIAEPVRDELGLTYLGFDLAEDGLEALKARNFDTYVIDLSDLAGAEAAIREAVSGRKIASLTFLDTMEHLTNGPEVLAMLRRLALEFSAPLVISVPNITHKDIAIKLLVGRLDITEAGILDFTHFALFSDAHLRRVTSSQGWVEIGVNDWLLERSDQFFPTDSVLNHHTPVGSELRSLSVQANKHALVNQFVRAYRPGEAGDSALYGGRAQPERPFLSVLIDACGLPRPETRRILGDLEQQTCRDLDVVLIVGPADGVKVDALDLAHPALKGRIVLVESSDPVRAARLNEAASRASGRYLSVVTGHDKLEASWAASFAALADSEAAPVLRVGRALPVTGGTSPAHDLAVDSDSILPVPVRGLISIAEWAVPGSAVRDLGMRFDRDLGVADLRDFVIQSGLLYGVVGSSAPVVSLGHENVEAGRRIDEKSYLGLLTKLNAVPLLLPPGSAERIERLSRSARIGETIAASPLLWNFVTHYIQPATDNPHRAPGDEAPPFLSVVIRTQGTAARIRTLREAILTLAGQTSQDFEVLLVVHSTDDSRFEAVRDLVEEFPGELSRRISLLRCERMGRSAPINVAVDHARGSYVAVFDDDDLLFAHWVETFEELARQAPGSALRTVAARQEFKLIGDEESGFARAESWFKMAWPSKYDAVDHLRTNFTPFMSMAFPAAAFTQLGMRFDESLTTAEDWQFATRVAMFCGVRSTPEVTAVYRWWTNGQSSAFLHERDEWVSNRKGILKELNARPVLLPPGATHRISGLIDEVLELRRKVEVLEARQSQASATAKPKSKPRQKDKPRKTRIHPSQRLLREILESSSWRATRPLRRVVNALRGRSGSGMTIENVPQSPEKAQRLVDEVRRSYSWRATAPLRKVVRLLRPSDIGK